MNSWYIVIGKPALQPLARSGLQKTPSCPGFGKKLFNNRIVQLFLIS